MRYLVLFALLGASSAASANECISIPNDLDRLACYDKAHGRTPKTERISAPDGNWTVDIEKSKLTDRENVYLYVNSDEIINCGWNRGDYITLAVRCMDNTTSLLISTGCHMVSNQYDDYGVVKYRLDDEKASSFRGQATTNHRSLGIPNGSRSIPLIKSMFGKKR